jgi:hypothetical protein
MPGNPGSFEGDTLYNRRLIEILRNYEKVNDFHEPTNMLVGGTRQRKMILSGDVSYDAESNFGTSGKATGGTVGGRAKIKKRGVAKALRTFGRAVKPLGKNLKPIKQAMGKKLIQQIDGFDGRVAQDIDPQEQVGEMYEVPEAEVDYTYGLPKLPGGRAYNQKKKGLAKLIRTVGMAVKPLNKNLKPIKQALANRMVEEIEASGHPKGSAKAHVAMARLRRLKAAKRAPMTMEQAMEEMDSGKSTLKKRKSKVGGAKPNQREEQWFQK